MSLEAAHKAFLANPKKGNTWILIVGMVLSLIIALSYVYEPVFFRFLDQKWYDALLPSAFPSRTSSNPVIVDIDELSLTRFGQWPWPRYRLALLLEKIKESGAACIALDMVFPEADRTSLTVLKRDIKEELKIDLDFKSLPLQIMDNDRILTKVFSEGPFVLGYKFVFSSPRILKRDCRLHAVPLTVIRTPGTIEGANFLYRSDRVVCNLKSFSEAVSHSGFFNILPDKDGVLRRIPLLIEFDRKIYPSLALATVMQAKGLKQLNIKTTPQGVESIRLGDTTIPVDANGNLLIQFPGKGRTFTYLSAGDFLSGAVSRERVQGKIVFIGTTAAGLGELRTTPVDEVYPGVEVHAAVVENILNKHFLSRPNWAPGLELLLVISSLVFSTLLLTWTGAVLSFLILGLWAVALWQVSIRLFQNQGIFISSLIPLTALGLNFTFLTLLKYWREERKVRERTKELALTQDFTILCLAALTETRDSETGGHILRCQRYIKVLARQLATYPKFAGILNPETIDLLYKSSPLHDIGKVGVPDSILLKPGRLTDEEFNVMKRHTLYGRQTLQLAEEKFGTGVNSSFLQYGKEMAYTHHEKWDGTGYPEGLQGENIPLFGRIMAIADVYDALICKRIYKPTFTHEEAVDLIFKQKGAFFDPYVVDAFIKVHEEFRQIAIEFADHEEERAALTRGAEK